MEDAALDAVDRGILSHLQQNARKSITDIADAVNVADNTVRNRIQTMEDRGVTEGYSVEIDYDRADVQHHYVFVCSARVSEREQLVDQARELPAVIEVVTLMTGTKNVSVLGAGSQKGDISELAYELDGLGLEVDEEYLVRDHLRKPFEEFRLDQIDR